MDLNALTALGALDGRYDRTAKKLRPYLSEFALIKYRLKMQAAYLVALSMEDGVPVRAFEWRDHDALKTVVDISETQARIIKKIETEGWGGIDRTNHDVAAAVAYLRNMLKKKTPLGDIVEWVHFGLTSEDCNNVAYALMLRDAVREVISPAMLEVVKCFDRFAKRYAELPMLSRTHGQAATPTTLGKEFRVWHARLWRQWGQLQNFRILVKLNGASGNYCAHTAALPEVDWEGFSENFVRSLNEGETGGRPLTFEWNPTTTQIEPHDTYVEFFDIVKRFNTILIDACQDIWRYVSDDWLVQKAVEGEVGSSAMPHKVNPINFENAEGNLGLANAMFEFFARKLPVSRLQRDLSDSTVERNFGYALGLSLKAYEEVVAGFGKISADVETIAAVLMDHPEVLAEAYQTILRSAGYADAYDRLKELTRGQPVQLSHLRDFAEKAEVSAEVKERLHVLRPETYIGLAPRLAEGE